MNRRKNEVTKILSLDQFSLFFHSSLKIKSFVFFNEVHWREKFGCSKFLMSISSPKWDFLFIKICQNTPKLSILSQIFFVVKAFFRWLSFTQSKKSFWLFFVKNPYCYFWRKKTFRNFVWGIQKVVKIFQLFDEHYEREHFRSFSKVTWNISDPQDSTGKCLYFIQKNIGSKKGYTLLKQCKIWLY